MCLLAASEHCGFAQNNHSCVCLMLVVRQIAAKYAESPVRFVWVDGKAQYEFAAAFGVRSTDLPTVLILSAHHRRFALLRGAFSEPAIASLVDGVLSGKVKTVSLQVRPPPSRLACALGQRARVSVNVNTGHDIS